MNRISLIQIAAMFARFNVDLMGCLESATSDDDVIVKFNDAKDAVKVSYKRIAFDTHPDRGGDVEKFKEITDLYNSIKKLELQVRQPRPQPVMRVTVQFNSSCVSSVATGTQTVYGNGMFW